MLIKLDFVVATFARTRSFSPLARTLASAAIVLKCALVLFVEPTFADITVKTDFPGGSADVKSIDSETGIIHITPSVRSRQGWPCWWYLKVDGANEAQSITLKLSATEREFRTGRVLAAAWSQPDRAAISVDNVQWDQTPKCQKESGVATYQFKAPARSFWLAWGPPFLPAHAEHVLNSLKSRLPGSAIFELAKTRNGQVVRGIRIGGDASTSSDNYGVWIQARQHAWEAGSSWVGRGFAEWLASDDPVAVKLRRHATIYYIPIMDADNVAMGAGGKDAVPRDHNRDWDDKPHYPEVAAAQKRIVELNSDRQFDVFVDLHNPGGSERRPYFFGPIDLERLPAIQQRNHARWLAFCASSISGTLPLEPQYKFATYVRTDEERNRMSANWVRNHTANHVLSTTLETAWNTPHSNQQGYMKVGAQLGMALGRYLESEPRAPEDALLYRKLPIPKDFLVTKKEHTFGGDVRIGDLIGDGRCDFLVYRSNHSGPSGPAIGGFKPCFLGAFEIDGTVLWSVGGGGTHPVRPGSVAIHDLDGDGAAEVICFWHQPKGKDKADWQSLADIVVQIRDGKTGEVIRQAAPKEITRRRCQPEAKPGQPKLSMGRRTANWVHQRIVVANFRGTDRPRDFVIKLGDTHVAFDDRLNVLWTYTTEWVEYSKCPAYIPAVGDIDGDGRDEVNSGYFLLDHDGKPLWKHQLGDNMDSVAITAWDSGRVRAICSGFGHVMDARGKAILSLGKGEVPHGQEVRVANLRDDLPGPEMVIRHNGHTPDAILVGSETNQIVSCFQLNASPTNVGMEPVFWNGPNKAALLYNGGWLWDLKTAKGNPLPDLPPPNGGKVHRMGFYHAISANLCGDDREELVLWDPTATDVYIYTPKPLDESAYRGYQAAPRQYNPRIMD